MTLVIDSDDNAFIGEVRQALETLLGGHQNVLRYQQVFSWRLTRRTKVEAGARFEHAGMTNPKVAELIERLINHRQHTTRIISGGGMGGGARPERGKFTKILTDRALMAKATTNGNGCDCCCIWNPLDLETANMTPLGHCANEPCPRSIILAHELIHADHITRGRFLTGVSNSVNVVNRLQRRTQGSMVMTDDIYNIGLADTDNAVPNDPNKITENDIRSEQNLNPRVLYGRYGGRIPQVRERRMSHHDVDQTGEVMPPENRGRRRSL